MFMHRVAGPVLPIARKFHCAANAGGVIYVAGAEAIPAATTGNLLHALSTAAPCTGVTAPTNGALGTCTSTLAAGASCQFTCNNYYVASGTTSCAAGGTTLTAATCTPPCTGVAAPTNGALGTCTSTLAAGSTCQFTCNDGYVASGTTSCAAGGTTLTAATCATNVWQSRNALPAVSLVPLQGALSFGTEMYTAINPPVGPLGIGASGNFHNYDSTTDLWATGIPPAPPASPPAHACCPRALAESCAETLSLPRPP
jgi:hypothetical protein